jgi:hypothetical protein
MVNGLFPKSKYNSSVKTCTKCKETKSVDLFARSKTHKNGISSWCKKCKSVSGSISTAKNKDHYKQYKQEWHKLNKDDPERIKYLRNHHLQQTYGISLQEYEQKLALQLNKCLICSKDQSTEKQAFAVDHCHTTGKIRGLLCCSCNRGIGYLKDSTELLSKSIEYLKNYEKEKITI